MLCKGEFNLRKQSMVIKTSRPQYQFPKTMGIVIILLIILVIQVGANNSPDYAYHAIENILVNCGGPSMSDQISGRKWDPDVDSDKFSFIDETHLPSSSSVKATTSDHQFNPSSHYAQLLATARVSRSQFTYSFRVTQGPKFVRLRFYPASYSNTNFARSSSVFSVHSSNFTLLKDFNASLTADNDRDPEDTVFREYCINVDETRLNITFIPSSSTHPDAYAFINAIEVVSMPNFLYYTKSTDPGMEFFGFGDESILYKIETTIALETLYRIEIGGNAIGAKDDTGMFRNWDADDDYLKDVRPSSLPNFFGPNSNIKYTAVPNYTAPVVEVYKNARSYGMKETSITYNLTWEFEVDSNFTYMVRLHFCEIEYKIHSVGQRVFMIFIAEYLAESDADLISWVGDNLTPYYRDYAVHIKGSLKKQNLSIKLQPNPSKEIHIEYLDVILNGIEIFKISDGDNNLGGPNPDPHPSFSNPFVPLDKTWNKTNMVIAIVVSVASSCLLVLSLVAFLRRQKHVNTSTTSKNRQGSSSLPSDLCRCFSIAEIKAATRNFDQEFIIGVGGFGDVYKGYIDDGMFPVAIKRLKKDSQQGVDEFLTEIEILSQVRHLHLVSLIGYCTDGDEMILVYEFMARGTLRDHLYGSDNPPLSWKQRLEMCLGAARGLHYLHMGVKHNIIHRDVKSTNILIDEKWVAKVSDFGLSKVGPTGMSKSYVSTVVKGSIGYLDPEYYMRQRLTEKSDVYSFGVVLLEVLCGRKPLDRTVEKQKTSLVGWVRKCYQEGMIHETIDPLVIESITPECLKAFSHMALSCLVDDGNERPSMNYVVWTLEFALRLQGSKEENEFMNESGTQDVEEEEPLMKPMMDSEESDEGFTSSNVTVTDSNSSKITICKSEPATASPHN